MVGAKITRKRMKALRFSNDVIDAVCQLVELHLRFHGYGDGRVDRLGGAPLRRATPATSSTRLHVLTRADCTTRNRRKAERLRRTYDDLEERIARLAEQEELDGDPARPRRQPDHGDPGHPPGPGGRARPTSFLLELRLDRGPMDQDARQRGAARVVGRPSPQRSPAAVTAAYPGAAASARRSAA